MRTLYLYIYCTVIVHTLQPTRDLSRFVKWPRYIRIQRQRKVSKSLVSIYIYPRSAFEVQSSHYRLIHRQSMFAADER
jgi:hypothetical protein